MPVVRTFGTNPCLMLIWHEAHPSSPPRLLQIKGTGHAPKWLSRANIPGGKPIVNKNHRDHGSESWWPDRLNTSKKKKKRRTRHAWEAKPTCWLHTDHQSTNVAFIVMMIWGEYSLFLFKFKKKKLVPFLFTPLTSVKRLRVLTSSPGSFCASWKLAGRRDELVSFSWR